MEKLLKKADDATVEKRFSEAMTWLKQARVLAPSEKQKEIDEKMQEVQKTGQRRKSVRYDRGTGTGNSPTTRQHERSATARYANKHIPGATNPYYES